jgi:hypothetical protein
MWDDMDEEFERELQQLLVEYKELRQEIVKRIELRQQILVLTLTIAGVIFGMAVKGNFEENSNSITLIFPPISLLLSMIWITNDYSVLKVSRYIRYRIESRIPAFGWEKFSDDMTWKNKDKYIRIAPYISFCGIFILTQFFAILIGSYQLILKLIFESYKFNDLVSSWFAFEFFGAAIGLISMFITLKFFLIWTTEKRQMLDDYAKEIFHKNVPNN